MGEAIVADLVFTPRVVPNIEFNRNIGLAWQTLPDS